MPTPNRHLMERSTQLGRAVSGRAYREWADVRRRLRRTGSAQRALDIFGDVTRADVTAWNQRTSDLHDAYRRSIEPVDASVAIICSSNRPTDIDNIVSSVAAQSHTDLEFVFVLHGDDWDVEEVERKCGGLSETLRRVQVLQHPASASLGTCLNAALDATSARFVAKFDSDDHYGTHYLTDALRAHRYAGAGVVGKHSYFAHLEQTARYLLRHPAREFTYTSTLAGGTLVIDRDVVGDQRFADVSIGEDGAFIRQCHRRGISTFAADRFSYTLIRTGSNTWTISDDDFLVDSIAFEPDWDSAQIEA